MPSSEGVSGTRTGIDLKTRSLCSIGILAALGRDNALKLNFEMALNNGAALEEIFEALMQVAVYAGFSYSMGRISQTGRSLE